MELDWPCADGEGDTWSGTLTPNFHSTTEGKRLTLDFKSNARQTLLQCGYLVESGLKLGVPGFEIEPLACSFYFIFISVLFLGNTRTILGRPRQFGPLSDDVDDTWTGTCPPSFRTTPTGGRLTPYI
ncbi:hypothetical protein AVEN_192257-1 [Araneus ventricosus]|uniref:Uncharacterized protein n=1 Tax=Araneus ventricosus TaxID=182803 RepID=A0A4Y2FJ52_ARAVE|nr:hypothetical protein AVEN_192257-1 [Araneus ventricosus]